jgi:hypothetical protein
VRYIERGYDRVVEKVRALGLPIDVKEEERSENSEE